VLLLDRDRACASVLLVVRCNVRQVAGLCFSIGCPKQSTYPLLSITSNARNPSPVSASSRCIGAPLPINSSYSKFRNRRMKVGIPTRPFVTGVVGLWVNLGCNVLEHKHYAVPPHHAPKIVKKGVMLFSMRALRYPSASAC
jgi:hypothetical protein